MTKKVQIKIDFHSAVLTPETTITTEYKNTQNVRRFFKAQIGEHFHFNREFMTWIKANKGKTLAHAVKEWKRTETKP